MQDHEILSMLKSIVCAIVDIDRAALGSETNMLFDLGISSAELMSLLLTVEETFDIEIGAQSALEAQTLGGFVARIAAELPKPCLTAG